MQLLCEVQADEARNEPLERLSRFRSVWLVCSQFDGGNGELPIPTLVEAREARSGQSLRFDANQLRDGGSPVPWGEEDLLVAYGAPAVLGCFLALGWPLPANVLDLEVEFRCHVSGLNETNDLPFEKALAFYHVEAPRSAFLESDALGGLLGRMLPLFDVRQALVRGRYTAAVALMERNGIPVDLPLLTRIRACWPALRASLIERVDRDYGVFDNEVFKENRWDNWLRGQGIPWPRLVGLSPFSLLL